MLHNETRVTEPHRRWFIPVAERHRWPSWSAPSHGRRRRVGCLRQRRSPRVAPSSMSTSATSTSNATAVTTQMALPAYFVGATSRAGTRFGLYREFVRTAVPAGATPAQKAKAAIAVAMNAQPSANIEPYAAAMVRNLGSGPHRHAEADHHHAQRPGGEAVVDGRADQARGAGARLDRAGGHRPRADPGEVRGRRRLREAVRDLPHRPDLQPPGNGPGLPGPRADLDHLPCARPGASGGYAGGGQG